MIINWKHYFGEDLWQAIERFQRFLKISTNHPKLAKDFWTLLRFLQKVLKIFGIPNTHFSLPEETVHKDLQKMFPRVLLKSNPMIILVQFGIKPLNIYKSLCILNCPQNHVINYTKWSIYTLFQIKSTQTPNPTGRAAHVYIAHIRAYSRWILIF